MNTESSSLPSVGTPQLNDSVTPAIQQQSSGEKKRARSYIYIGLFALFLVTGIGIMAIYILNSHEKGQGLQRYKETLQQLQNSSLKNDTQMNGNFQSSTAPSPAGIPLAMYVLPEKYHNLLSLDLPSFSNDGKMAINIALGSQSDSSSISGMFYILEGKELKEYQEVRGFTFSPDGNHYAYVATKADNKQIIVEDGIEGKEYDAIDANMTTPVFSPDSTTLAYTAQHDGKVYLVRNGQEEKGYEGVYVVYLSPDGKHYGYHARFNDKQWVVVIDGKELAQTDGYGDITFSKNSQHFIFNTWVGNKECLYFDGVQKDCGDSTGDIRYEFANDTDISYSLINPQDSTGTLVGYVSIQGKKTAISLTGNVSHWVSVTPDGENYYFDDYTKSDCSGNYGLLNINGKIISGLGGIYNETVSPDSKMLAFSQLLLTADCSTGNNAYLLETSDMKGNVTLLKHVKQAGQFNLLQFAPNSQDLLYVTTEGIVGFRGKEFTYRFGGIVGASTGSPVFSSDSKKVAYISTDSTGKYPGKVFIVVNDHAFETYDEIYKNPVFSPDNTKIMYPAQRGHTFYWVVNNVAAIQ